MTDLSTEALMARRRIAERLEQAPWAFEPHGDTGDYGVGILLDDNAIAVSGEQQTGERFVAEVVAVEVKGVGYATHIAANDPTTVIATIDELLRLREQVEALTKHPGSPTPGETMNELDKLEKYLRNQDLFNSLEALRGLRAKCARLEREANWLAGSLNELDKLEKYLKNQDLFDSLEALRGLRAKCARLEREANWLAGSLPIGAHGSCDDARKRWRDVARKAVEESMTEVKPKLYEIVSQIKFATVILATSEQQALAYVKGCLSAKDMLIPSNADCIGYNSDFDVEDIRDVPSGYDTEKILEDLAHHDATEFEVEEQPCPKN